MNEKGGWRLLFGFNANRLRLGSERRPAPTRRFRVRILDHELGALQILLVVDFRADEILEAQRID